MRFSRLLLASTALAAVAVPAYAQTPDTTAPTSTSTEAADDTSQNSQTADAAEETIVVTGSRISRPNLVSSVPITTLTANELRVTGDVSLGDTLNDLPALRSTFSQANSTRFIGTSGLNLLDLRGLGSLRTLVLVNGRRHITSQPGNFNVDTNTIPSDLIERVDVVTGGNSAIYGSDAIAGVVNFITKRDFEGVSARGQYGISDRNDRDAYFASLTGGLNFGADDRGNIAVNVEYSKSKTLFFTDRDGQTGALTGRRQFNNVEITGPNLNPRLGTVRTTPEPATGNGIPDQVFFNGGIRNNNISLGGLFTASCPLTAAAGESAAAFAARRALACSGTPLQSSANPLAEFGRTYVFNDAGQFVPNPITRDFRPFGSANALGGLGSTLRETGMLQPGLERKSANLLFNYEFSPAFKPFVEAKIVRIDANQEGQPTFFNNTFSIDNPFLTAANRAAIVAVLPPGATTFSAFRFNVDFGGRGEDHQRDIYRIVGGVEGEFNDDWRYEVAFNYGRLETFYATQGNVDIAKYGRAVNAVRNAAGNIVCAVNADASTTNDDPACVPVNLFGNGAPSQAALDYFVVESTREQEAEQYNATAFVSGDTSEFFELPGGPVGFAIGAEYRRETAFSAFDPFTISGGTFLNSIAVFDPPAFVVKEAFGELRLPILAGVPLAEELTIEASGRVSDYKGATGTVFAYNLGGTYAPVEDVRFRVGYGRSVRAPNLGELFQASNQTFLNGLIDPCGQQNINNNPNRVANCAAAGVPTTQTFNGITEPFSNIPSSGIAGVSQGNPNLKEETSDSLTVGAVLQPSAIPGLSLTVDYYDITVDDVITTPTAQNLINYCYDSPSGIDNQFCASVFRNPNGTFRGQQNVQHAGTSVSFPTTGSSFTLQNLNYAKLETSGVDVDVNYRTQLGSIDASFRAIGSWVIKRNQFLDPTQPTFADRLKTQLGDAAFEAGFDATLDFGKFDFDYKLRYIGKQTVAVEYETQNPFQGRPATNPDQFETVFYPDVFYHNIRAGYDVNDNFRLYAGVDNLFDRLPPLDLLGTAGGDPFDNVGRFFYAGVSVNF
jgi:outer membrane receptor protein involved in Fe transport